MPDPNYDPAKAHQYYLQNRKLKGRHHGAGQQPTQHIQRHQNQAATSKKIGEIEAKLSRLRNLLNQKLASSKSSGKTVNKSADKIKAQQNSKQYYQQHKNQIKADKKKAGHGSGGSTSKAKTANDMSVDELKTAIRKTVIQLKEAIAAARRSGGG